MMMPPDVEAPLIVETIDTLLAARAADASICPSEVARAIAPDNWRPLMAQIRTVAAYLALSGDVRITQGNHTISPQAVLAGDVRGPIRLRRA